MRLVVTSATTCKSASTKMNRRKLVRCTCKDRLPSRVSHPADDLMMMPAFRCSLEGLDGVRYDRDAGDGLG